MNFGLRPSLCRRSSVLSSASIGMPSASISICSTSRLVGAERRHGTRVGGRLGDDHVAGVDQRLAHQVDHLLAAGRDDHLGGVRQRALGGHHLDDAADRRGHPLGGPVLQGARGGLGGHLRHQLRVQLRRERARVRQAAGQRDHVRALGQRHHLAHRRAFHAARARREQRLVARQLVRRRTGPRPSPPALVDRFISFSPLFAAVPPKPRRERLTAGRVVYRPDRSASAGHPHGIAPPTRSLA